MHGRTGKMNLDTAKLIECVDWEGITDDKVTINVDGEKLRETIYNEVKVTIKQHHEDSFGLYSNGLMFCNITPGGIFSEDDCRQLAIEIQNKLNNRIRSKLDL